MEAVRGYHEAVDPGASMENGVNQLAAKKRAAGRLLEEAAAALQTEPDGVVFGKWIQLIRAAIDGAPADSAPLLRIGHALEDQGRHEAALDFFVEAVRLQPESPLTWTNLGEIRRKLGRWDEALAAYDKALSLDALYLWALAGRGEALRMVGRLDEAVVAFGSAIARAPDHLFALQGLAATLSELGRHRDALPVWEAALRMRPESGFASDGLARCHDALAKELAS
jgi:tetratricopeptide (TPR) repeat protein